MAMKKTFARLASCGRGENVYHAGWRHLPLPLQRVAIPNPTGFRETWMRAEPPVPLRTGPTILLQRRLLSAAILISCRWDCYGSI